MKKAFKFIVSLLALMIVSIFSFVACTITEPPVEPTFTLDHTSIELTVDELQSLTLTIANVEDTPVWTSSNPDVATVTVSTSPNQATVKGIKKGTTVISVEAGELIQVCSVTVKAGPYVTISPETLQLFVGRTGNITVDTNITTALTYTSQNPQIAQVNNEGLVTAVAEGETNIVVSGGNKTATCKVVVSAPYVNLEQTQIDLVVDGNNTYQLTAESNGKVEWESSNEAVATVDQNGLVTAVSSGEATITASFLSAEATCTVTVEPATAIQLNSAANVTLEISGEATISAQVNRGGLTYVSSNEEVATVDQNGKITALKAGDATITVTSTDNTELSVTVEVKVMPAVELSVKGETSIEMEINADHTVELNLNRENDNGVWSSSNEEVATVDQNGKVTAIKDGDTVIKYVSGIDSTKMVEVSVKVLPEIIVSVIETIEIKVNGETQLNATASRGGVTYESADNTIVEVTADGTIKGLKVGETTVTVKSTIDSTKTAVCTIAVKENVEVSIILNKTELNLDWGETETLVATINDGNVAWTSSDETVATVDQNGKVTALQKNGPVIITATSVKDETKKATCTVTVEYVNPVIEITNPASGIYEMEIEDELAIEYSVTKGGVTVKVEGDEGIVTVDGAKLTAVTAGTVTVTLVSNDNEDVTKSFTVNVNRAPTIEITNASEAEDALQAGNELTLTAEANREDGTISWSSSNEAVATVDQDGKITAIGAGKTVITVKFVTTSGKEVSKTIEIEVIANPHEPTVVTLTFVEVYNDVYMHFIASEYVTTDRATVNGTDTIHNEWSNGDDGAHFKVNVGNVNLSEYKFEFYSNGVLVATATYTQDVQVPNPNPNPGEDEGAITLKYVSKDQYRMQFEITNAPASYNYVKVNGTQYDSKIENGIFDVYVGDTTKSEYVFVFVLNGQDIATATYTQDVQVPDPEQPEHEHTWAETWSYDGINHWKKCTDIACQGTNDKAAHDFTNGDTCPVCGYVKGDEGTEPEVVVVTLTFVEVYNDVYMHFIASENVTTDRATVNGADTAHNEWFNGGDGAHFKVNVGDVNLSEYKFEFYNNGVLVATATYTQSVHEHTWAETWSYDGTNHWKKCTDEACKATNDKAAHDFTNGDTCLVCGYVKGDEGTKPEVAVVTLNYVETYGGFYFHFIASEYVTTDRATVNGTDTTHNEWSNGGDGTHFKVYVGDVNLSEYKFEFYNNGVLVATATYTQNVQVPDPKPNPGEDDGAITLKYVSKDQYRMQFEITNAPASYNYVKVNGIQYDSKIENGIFDVYVGDTTKSEYVFVFVLNGQDIATATYTVAGEETEQPDNGGDNGVTEDNNGGTEDNNGGGEATTTDTVDFSYASNWINYTVKNVVSSFDYANISSVYVDGAQMTNAMHFGNGGMIFYRDLSAGQHTVRFVDNTGAEVTFTFNYAG